MDDLEINDDVQVNTYEKFGGLLIVVGIGVVGSLILSLSNLNKLSSYFLNTANKIYLQSHPAIKTLIYLQILFGVILLMFCILSIITYFKKNRYFPKIAITSRAYIILTYIIQYFVIVRIPHVSKAYVNSSVTQFITYSIVNLLWIPYFVFSKRVKYTFIK